uniref:Uncharacterized protein n=1 Tax=Corethron hystrix TaxID=216773 RepID=A0A7S1FRW0_9STRA|mmetsp:Transcript_22779/g.52197  ORF Transcript_22779/g.52197 Transcript_22779/m.52197 type:complete len:217 (+) Transcript_22779:178-828(+)|eukprot:CAMPEP_0113310444 /NCGR_PEP_ID=MMETSP0010_2-20120614/8086_1 /TAXON_ID=216773 ORGANISM="Corethron hystrix, Strain 308" /NCGR_SAMPLE_ID=MMETSP0010_2 /ASSEMBLY_ACC=CAM_ASM_000155 /LENGTH=216 /DNA_ID=CAMNT_0000165899 /DNA_START=132 /DNA_END=782 /DNA_ORIENTATION=- /assembly_acc=CAM_ASM_000155
MNQQTHDQHSLPPPPPPSYRYAEQNDQYSSLPLAEATVVQSEDIQLSTQTKSSAPPAIAVACPAENFQDEIPSPPAYEELLQYDPDNKSYAPNGNSPSNQHKVALLNAKYSDTKTRSEEAAGMRHAKKMVREEADRNKFANFYSKKRDKEGLEMPDSSAPTTYKMDTSKYDRKEQELFAAPEPPKENGYQVSEYKADYEYQCTEYDSIYDRPSYLV